MTDKIAIIGTGLSGLACALELQKNNKQVTLFEKTSSVGGRVKTDQVDGFLLDHGFQVFLPSYEMGKYFLNYDELNLKPFKPGAFIHKGDRFFSLSNPLKDPMQAFATATSPLATLKDKVLTLKLLLSVKSIKYKSIKTQVHALELLQDFGFSKKYINHFFIPFFSGVFLTKKLDVPADYFKYLFNKFATSNACLPEKGMSQIPNQMAHQIGHKNINLNSEKQASELLQEGYDHVFITHPIPQKESGKQKFHSVKTEYYKTKSKRWAKKTLFLNSSENSVVNHIACLSAANSNYAPAGWNLFSVNVLQGSQKETKSDLIKLFSAEEINTWQHIKTYEIKKALPSNAAYGMNSTNKEPNVSFCGDYLESPSIQGALLSGQKAAQNFIKQLSS